MNRIYSLLLSFPTSLNFPFHHLVHYSLFILALFRKVVSKNYRGQKKVITNHQKVGFIIIYKSKKENKNT
jgi:hypothetical protein